MNTEVVEDEMLQCFLDSINVNERQDEDGVGAVCKFSYSFEIVSEGDAGDIFAVERAATLLKIPGICQDFRQKLVNQIN